MSSQSAFTVASAVNVISALGAYSLPLISQALNFCVSAGGVKAFSGSLNALPAVAVAASIVPLPPLAS